MRRACSVLDRWRRASEPRRPAPLRSAARSRCPRRGAPARVASRSIGLRELVRGRGCAGRGAGAWCVRDAARCCKRASAAWRRAVRVSRRGCSPPSSMLGCSWPSNAATRPRKTSRSRTSPSAPVRRRSRRRSDWSRLRVEDGVSSSSSSVARRARVVTRSLWICFDGVALFEVVQALAYSLEMRELRDARPPRAADGRWRRALVASSLSFGLAGVRGAFQDSTHFDTTVRCIGWPELAASEDIS